MARTRTLLDWLGLDQRSGQPLYRQIYEQIRTAVVSGRLIAGTRVPASRSLAASLGVSRITVLQAYDQLIAEGFFGIASRLRDTGSRRCSVASQSGERRSQLRSMASASILMPAPRFTCPVLRQPVLRSGPAFPASTPSPDSFGRGCCTAMRDGSTKE